MFTAQRRDLGVIVAGDRKERVRDDHVHRFVAEQVGGVRPVERHEQAMLASHGLAESSEAHGVYAGPDVHTSDAPTNCGACRCDHTVATARH